MVENKVKPHEARLPFFEANQELTRAITRESGMFQRLDQGSNNYIDYQDESERVEEVGLDEASLGFARRGVAIFEDSGPTQERVDKLRVDEWVFVLAKSLQVDARALIRKAYSEKIRLDDYKIGLERAMALVEEATGIDIKDGVVNYPLLVGHDDPKENARDFASDFQHEYLIENKTQLEDIIRKLIIKRAKDKLSKPIDETDVIDLDLDLIKDILALVFLFSNKYADRLR